MKKTIAVPVWFAALIVLGMLFSSVHLFAAEPDKTGCAEGPVATGPVNPDCPIVSRPRFRLR